MSTCADIITRSLRKLNAVPLGATPLDAEVQNALIVLSSIVGEYYRRGVFGRGAARPPTLTTSSTPFGDDYLDATASMLALRLAVDYGPANQPSALDTAAAKEFDADLMAGRAETATDIVTRPFEVADVTYLAARHLLGIRANALTPFQLQTALDQARAMFGEWAQHGYYGRGTPAPDTSPTAVSPAGDTYSEAAAGMLAVRLADAWGVEATPVVVGLAQTMQVALTEGRLQTAATTSGLTPSVADIIYGAARQLMGIKGGALSFYQAQSALDALRGLFLQWVAQGVFGAMWDSAPIVGGEHDIYPNQRVMAEANPHLHLQDRFPAWFREGRRAWGCGPYDYPAAYWPVPAGNWVLPPRDLSVTTVANPDGGDSSTYVYDAQAGLWQNLSKAGARFDTASGAWTDDITLPCPLAQKYGETLKACLAVRIADDMGVEAKPTTVQSAKMGLSAMAQRWDSFHERQEGTYF